MGVGVILQDVDQEENQTGGWAGVPGGGVVTWFWTAEAPGDDVQKAGSPSEATGKVGGR